ncbi:hypothetical protein AAG570_006626 [Ranatra chinensis]|uniref:CCD97-like C-terminal domain-containing protein n=1 Tax=Ranatra chinensis TaxID=642074 RepID=A0ABD0ZBK6_9HEMI
MLVHLCDRSDAHFKSQQLGEPELTRHQKWQIAEELLNKSKPQFLARFAQHLLPEHTRYFKGTRAFDGEGESNAEDDYTVKFYLEAEVKNRRLEALKRLIIKGEYFSESEMKKRNPLLYEELVGKYLSEDEKIKRNDFDYSGATYVVNFFYSCLEPRYMTKWLYSQLYILP